MKPFKGNLNVRIGEELHKKAASLAASKDISINSFIKMAIKHEIENILGF